jgi:hypothetical protein
MENLVSALEGKQLGDLRKTSVVSKSNLIEPTKAEIELILTALAEGKGYKEIKKTIRRVEEGSAKGFSYGQIKEIDTARWSTIDILDPQPDPEDNFPLD